MRFRSSIAGALLGGMLVFVGGAIYAQYQMYIGPDTIAGLSVSLNIVFAAVIIAVALYMLARNISLSPA